jgi:Ras-related protein Rab-7A
MILIGDSGVGKTSLISQYVHRKFKKNYEMTIGFNITVKELEVDGKKISLSINDVGGQDRFEGVRHMFYPGTHLALLVYDVTRPDSLENLVDWLKEINEFNPPREDEPPVQMIVVGNKCDLEDTRMTERDEGEDLVKKIRAIKHIETSARDNKNVDIAFYDLVKAFLDKVVDENFYLMNYS